ncbi:hypothetical protein [Piscirickettsia litoralis]|uniref:Uncharacterized protein n=1 Tax=Piscirickettsia litoralis TaxID=1891921 RepID=A0ABX3A5Q6_9GAMM|nr:hypothetical protein [Piscirickettsia litoralis]ODN43875.1 hypothetical protein BGC07_14485 [Piscirickettsia litoralis]
MNFRHWKLKGCPDIKNPIILGIKPPDNISNVQKLESFHPKGYLVHQHIISIKHKILESFNMIEDQNLKIASKKSS